MVQIGRLYKVHSLARNFRLAAINQRTVVQWAAHERPTWGIERGKRGNGARLCDEHRSETSGRRDTSARDREHRSNSVSSRTAVNDELTIQTTSQPLTASSFAFRPKFLACFAVQTFGICLIGTGFGDRFFPARTHAGYSATLAGRSRSGAPRQASSYADYKGQQHRADE